MPVSKKYLANNIAKKLRLSKKDSLFFVNFFFESIAINHNKKISIRNFGTFESKESPRRLGRNPKSMEEFEIRPRKKLSFRASEEFKKSIN